MLLVALALSGCGGGGAGGGPGGGATSSSCTISSGFCGTLTGLPTGQTVTLYFETSDAGSGNLTLDANGPFTYGLNYAIDISTTYGVGVVTDPPSASCSVTNGGSNVSASGLKTTVVSGVVVTCTPAVSYTIGGTLTGLNAGAQVTIENNGANPLKLSANGAFTFAMPVANLGSYAVTVSAQPTDQICTVGNGTGSKVTADVTNVIVDCKQAYAVGGTLTGLNGGVQLTLVNNGADPLTLTADGAFTFSTPVAVGDPYRVTVDTQPTDQVCSVTNGSGSISGTVANVQVGCMTIEQALYTFSGGTDGAQPNAGLLMDGSGALYGTASSGGAGGSGAVFKLTPGSGGYTESVLYSFTGGADGASPEGGMIMDSAGNLYGTTFGGGSRGFGTVFRLAPNGSGGYTESVLYSFTGGSDQPAPDGRLLMDGAANLYGTTAGGVNGYGTVFKLTPNGSGGYTESFLYSFKGGAGDGADPHTDLLIDSAGNLYGTTTGGGSSNCAPNGCGTVFKLAPNGSGGYTESLLYSFKGGASDGADPYAGLIMDGAGNLYGTTPAGGTNDDGTVFRLTPDGSGGYAESVLYSVGTDAGGTGPAAPLVMDGAGNLYGTILGYMPSYGTVFRLAPDGSGGYTESDLYRFTGGRDGGSPKAGLIMDSAGKLYGTTSGGGTVTNSCNNGCGLVFEVTPY